MKNSRVRAGDPLLAAVQEHSKHHVLLHYEHVSDSTCARLQGAKTLEPMCGHADSLTQEWMAVKTEASPEEACEMVGKSEVARMEAQLAAQLEVMVDTAGQLAGE